MTHEYSGTAPSKFTDVRTPPTIRNVATRTVSPQSKFYRIYSFCEQKKRFHRFLYGMKSLHSHPCSEKPSSFGESSFIYSEIVFETNKRGDVDEGD